MPHVSYHISRAFLLRTYPEPELKTSPFRKDVLPNFLKRRPTYNGLLLNSDDENSEVPFHKISFLTEAIVVIDPLSEFSGPVCHKTSDSPSVLDFSELALLLWSPKNDFIASSSKIRIKSNANCLKELDA